MARRGIAVVAAFALALGISAHSGASAASSDQQRPAVSNAREIDPADLPRGPDAAIDYLQDGVLHTAEGQAVGVPIRHKEDQLALLGRSGTSWLVAFGAGYDEESGYYGYGISRVRSGRPPEVLPRLAMAGYPGDLHSWRLDRDGQMLVSTLYDRGGATAYVREVSTGARLARRFSGTYSPPLDVADGHVARVHADGGIYDWQPRERTQTRIAPGAAFVALRADLLFVPVGKKTYGPRSISARNVPAWAANFLPIDISPDGQSVLGLNGRFPKHRVLLQVRSLNEGTLLDSVDFGDHLTFTPQSFASAPEQTMRWESDSSFVVQVELKGGSVLVRCRVGGKCWRASDIGGNISTAYEYFTWASG